MIRYILFFNLNYFSLLKDMPFTDSRERGRERESRVRVQCGPQAGIEPTVWVCALIRNQTCDPSVPFDAPTN